MTYSASRNQCCECGDPAEHNLICAKCEPDYADKPFSDDVCRCVVCASDLVGIVPCVGDGK